MHKSGRSKQKLCFLAVLCCIVSALILPSGCENETAASISNCTNTEAGCDESRSVSNGAIPQLEAPGLTDVYNDECTIASSIYKNEYLSMKSGWIHKYAVLTHGNPKSEGKGKWDWRAVWRITHTVVDRQRVFLMRDHHTAKFLSFNRDMYSFVRGETNVRIKDNLWIISKVGEGPEVTIQRFMSPREYLHAKTEKDTRQLVLVKDKSARGSRWLIDCSRDNSTL